MDTINQPLRVAMIGAGNRSSVYAAYAEKEPGRMRIAAVVEPDAVRLEQAGERWSIPPARRYASVESMLADPELSVEAAVNGTMDALHLETTLPLLAAGLDVLLEKPIGISKDEVLRLLEAARSTGRKVMICHVLRYAPFYRSVKERIAAGDIGDILSLQTEENVSYHHMATAFVRGKWNRKDRCGSSMLMQKCCHDLDLIAWFKEGSAPVKVASFGGRTFFRSERAPEGAGTRCLTDCRIEGTCTFSARRLYVDRGLWSQYAWHSVERETLHPTTEQKLASLREDNPYGRCVWHCDNDVVDHQTVTVEFADGSTASHAMTGGSPRPCRTVHAIGTKGEIYGVMEDGYFVVRRPDPEAEGMYREETVRLDVADDMHGGGDLRLVDDFVSVLRGAEPSISTSSLEDSVYGHLIGFAADEAMEREAVVSVPSLS
ncbi:Gfo/Idh/MocA family oxidoreductase [Paenibacillus methanolicus]|uniref:Oxidoreductase family protein n=1 Tax=Paenibacillus methanolicus TaxID=582686 RepID=A0A5S5CK67_9BACL|nr:Gfo/Idh/MocA family oxidoreductase [Paenibacillus methanolicus]TYP79393.1 oxidoreductase family protein [Paenibacillus methanolicus]